MARYISELDKEITELGSQIPKFDGVVVLLRLEDAFDNLMHQAGAELHRVNDEHNLDRAGTFRFAVSGIALVEDGLTQLFKLGKETGHLLDDWPIMEFFYGYPKNGEGIVKVAKRIGFITEEDYWKTVTVSQGISGVQGRALLKLDAPSVKTKNLTIDIIWYWLGLIQKKNISSFVLWQGGMVEESSEGNLKVISVKEETKERTDFGRTYQDWLKAQAAYTAPHEWGSEFKQKGVEAALTVDRGKFSQENIEAVAAEMAELAKAYRNIPRYRATFRAVTGYKFDDFVRFTEFLERLSRLCDHNVYYGTESEFMEAARSSSFSPNLASKLIKSMTWRVNSRPVSFPIFYVSGRVIFSLRRILVLSISRPLEIFEHQLNTEIRGRVLEQNCRRLLRARKLSVYPRRLPSAGFLPLAVSYELWGFEKQKSDIDVIAAQGDAILIVECKELSGEDKRGGRFGTSDLNVLLKAARENFYKTLWLAENWRKLPEHMATKFLSIAKPKTFVPLVVTNQQIRHTGSSDSAAVLALEDLLKLTDGFAKNESPFVSGGVMLINTDPPGTSLETPVVPIS